MIETREQLVSSRKSKKISQDEMAALLEIPRSTYANKEKTGSFTRDEIDKIQVKLGQEVSALFSITMNDKPAVYGKGKFKLVDSQQLIVHDMLQIKAMNRVMLRTLAEIMAHQQGKTVTAVLAELSKAVKDETAEAFDSL